MSLSPKNLTLVQTDLQIKEKYIAVRKRTEALCSPLKEEDTVVQPMVDVSPPKWHLGHTTWFFENFLLAEHLPAYKHYNKRLNYIFNSYYESQGERILRANRGNLTRPTLKEVLAYRNYVDKYMLVLLDEVQGLEDWIELGLQHEMQHQELLVTDIKYILGNNPLFPVYLEQAHQPFNPEYNWENEMIHIPNGVYEIGFNGDGFHFDNELGKHKVYLEEFEIAQKLTTNAEYLQFMQEGGYDNYRYWLSEGWEWAKNLETKAPLYWFYSEDKWWQFTMAGLKEVNLEEPVMHINYYEADAFARWKGMRLPTEFEWEIACKAVGEPIDQHCNLLEKEVYHAKVQGKNLDFIGNLWEWTSSAYLPYPYYEQASGALGEYNGKFMVNQMVLRGGSTATPFEQIRSSYRNFFHADKQWQFTGIRLARHI